MCTATARAALFTRTSHGVYPRAKTECEKKKRKLLLLRRLTPPVCQQICNTHLQKRKRKTLPPLRLVLSRLADLVVWFVQLLLVTVVPSSLALDGVVQDRLQTHASGAVLFLFLAALSVFRIAQPAPPQRTGEASVVVETAAEHVVLPPAESTRLFAFRVIEDLVHVVEIPIAVEENRVRYVRSLQAVVKSD